MEQKKGRRNKNFKKGAKLDQGVDALKKGRGDGGGKGGGEGGGRAGAGTP